MSAKDYRLIMSPSMGKFMDEFKYWMWQPNPFKSYFVDHKDLETNHGGINSGNNGKNKDRS